MAKTVFTVIVLSGITAVAQETGAPEAAQPAAAVSKDISTELNKAFDASGQWYCYKKIKGNNRLKSLGQNTYYSPQDAELFKLISFGGKNYVRTPKGQIYEESWENASNFKSRFVERNKIVKETSDKLDEITRQTKEIQKEGEENKHRQDDCKQTISRLNASINSLRNESQEAKNSDYVRQKVNQLENARRDQSQMLKNLQKREREIKTTLKKFIPQQQELEKLKKRLDQLSENETDADTQGSTK